MGVHVAPKDKPKPVVIAHLRLDRGLADKPPKMEGGLKGWTLKDGGGVWIKDQWEQQAENDAARKRIKEINAYLGSHEYALSHARLSGSPMTLLIERGSAKAEEFQAAQEIELAYFAISGAMMFKPQSWQRHSKGKPKEWNNKTSAAVQQYQSWANHWSGRRKSHLDYTLECVISAVIDQRPMRVIAADLGFHHDKIQRAVLGGLRDYAARAGWVDGKIAGQWMDAAEQTFKRRAVA